MPDSVGNGVYRIAEKEKPVKADRPTEGQSNVGPKGGVPLMGWDS